MADKAVEFLQSITQNPYLIVFLVSMLPLIELKGAIPIGAKLGLGLMESSILAYLGSTVVVLCVFFLIKYVFILLKKIRFIKKLVLKVEYVINKKAQNLAKRSQNKAEDVKNKIIFLGLLTFVAIPVPLTGVWTGAAIAVFLDMRFLPSAIALIAGNLISGAIITLLTFLFKDYVDTIILIILILAIVLLIVTIVKVIMSPAAEDEKSLPGDKS